MKNQIEYPQNQHLINKLDSTLERNELYNIIDMLLCLQDVKSWNGFERFVYKELRRFLPHENIVFVYAKREDYVKKKPSVDVLNVSYSPQYIEEYVDYDMNMTDACLRSFLATGRLYRWLDINAINPNPDPGADISFDYKMNDGLTFGAFDSDNPEFATVMCIGCENEDNSERSKLVYELLAQAFSKHFMIVRKLPRPVQTVPGKKMTPVQQRTLWLAGNGLSRKEIAYKFNISQTAVDKRLQKAREILSAVTDQEAHDMAIALGYYTPYSDGLGIKLTHSEISSYYIKK